MALVCGTKRRDLVSLLVSKFLFLSDVQVFSDEISFVCHLKYPYI